MITTERIAYCALTDVGVKRSHNQDSFGAVPAPSDEAYQTFGHLFIVCDGMGAHAVGELASKMAVDTIQTVYPKLREEDPKAALRKSVLEANRTLLEKGKKNPEFRGMGTTATALALLPEGAYLAHVGDSRCYRVRDNNISQLSFDHSLRWEVAKQRKIDPEQLTNVPNNVIVRSLGPDPKVKVDVTGPYPVQKNDVFVLCSDGLSGLVRDAEIWAAVTHLALDEACQFLIDLANLRGGVDNITVVVVKMNQNPRSGLERGWTGLMQGLAGWTLRMLSFIPIKVWLVLGGIVCAVLALLLGRRDVGGAWASIGSVVFLLSFLIFQTFERQFPIPRRRRRRVSDEEATPIHRSSNQVLDDSFIDSIVVLENQLWELATVEGWQLDMDRLTAESQAAQEASEAGDLPAAYLHHCRFLSQLCHVLREYHQTKEVMRPRWQKKEGA